MMRITILAALIIGGTLLANAQCPPGRYHSEVFDSLTISYDVVYGKSVKHTGDTLILTMDFYEPTGDTLDERPLVILAYGGFFLTGSKRDGDVNELCKLYARRGIPCASIDYRTGITGIWPDSVNLTEAVTRAVQDGKAAIRYFKKDKATTDTLAIDTSQIYIGGSSAGGFLGLHLAFMTDTTILPVWVKDIIRAEGGLIGASGNPGYSANVKGVLSYAGAIKDTAWIQPGGPIVWMSHSEDDITVPYGKGNVTYFGSDIIEVVGSKGIAEKITANGGEVVFVSFEGDQHPPQLFSAPKREQTVAYSSYFIYEHLDCYIPTNIEEPVPNIDLTQFASEFKVSAVGEYLLNAYSMDGKLIHRVYGVDEVVVQTGEWQSGVYVVQIVNEEGAATKKIFIP